MAVIEKITVGQGLGIIKRTFDSWLDSSEITSEEADLVGRVVLGDVEIRDYLLGLPFEQSSYLTAGGFIESLLEKVSAEYKHPLLSVISTYYYEVDEVEMANEALRESMTLHPNYPLNTLLEQMYKENRPSPFLQMSKSLHPKVVESLEARSENLLGE